MLLKLSEINSLPVRHACLVVPSNSIVLNSQ